MGSGRRARKRAAAGPVSPAGVAELQRALDEANRKLQAAESRKARAVARATSALRKENEMLEAQLTRVVQEIGQLRMVVDRVEGLERELRAKEARIVEAESETERLRVALNSGRPTARAAAAASQAARLFGPGR